MVSRTLIQHDGPFELVWELRGDRLLLRFAGELDLACTDLLAANPYEDDDGIADVMLDMTGLEFVDTAGIRALLAVQSRHLERGRGFVVRNPSALVSKVAHLFGRPDLLNSRRPARG